MCNRNGGEWDCAGCTSFLCLGPVLSLEKLSEKWRACPQAIWLCKNSNEKSSGARKEVEMPLAAWLLNVGNQSLGEPVKDVSRREDHEPGHSIWQCDRSVLMVKQFDLLSIQTFILNSIRRSVNQAINSYLSKPFTPALLLLFFSPCRKKIEIS